ncbi:tetratricopeptide repeat protein [Streptomyces uncialis]|uniref:tetratricopeptide repeat protein n=1 Tax=Streptomyces uncialis TaxID=1048205 RepID=UPI002E3709F9|nr:tetratricopeptide repeat protein [Streptomyces uncialis]
MKATTTSAIRALECPEEAAAAAAASPAAVRWRRARRALTVTAVLGLVAGGAAALVMWPQPRTAVPPAPGPGARALSAVETGTPAASADLTALIAERVRHLRAHPRDDESWAVLGAAYAERGTRTGDSADFPRAQRALESSLAARPEGNARALTASAQLALARQDPRAAAGQAERAVRIAPERWPGYPPLIDAYRGLGDDKAAGKALETLRGLRAPEVVVRFAAARLYRDRGWREDAAANLGDVVAAARSATEEADARRLLGELAAERGEPERALGWFDGALRVGPDRYEALAGRARALAALGRSGEAVRVYREAYAGRPVPEYALELGELHESLGAGREARERYDVVRERVRARDAHGVRGGLLLGTLDADHGDADAVGSAVSLLRDETEARGASPVALDAYAWALFRAGEVSAADALYREVRQKGGRGALFAYHRAEVALSLGDPGSARRGFGEVLRVNPFVSPLVGVRVRGALAELGEPSPGGPEVTHGPAQPMTSPSPSPSPSPS